MVLTARASECGLLAVREMFLKPRDVSQTVLTFVRHWINNTLYYQGASPRFASDTFLTGRQRAP